MIKVVSKSGDEVLVLLGLSEGNLQRLQKGKPILVQLPELGLKGRVVLFYGETEETMVCDLQEAGWPLYKIEVVPEETEVVPEETEETDDA